VSRKKILLYPLILSLSKDYQFTLAPNNIPFFLIPLVLSLDGRELKREGELNMGEGDRERV
jgi:hypothetical protein